MTKRIAIGMGIIALLALVASIAWTQGGFGWGRGCAWRWSTMKPEDQQNVANLHGKIRQTQWELYSLQQAGGDQEKAAKTQKELVQLRDQLHKVMVATRPATCPYAGQPNVPCPQPNCPLVGGAGTPPGGGLGCGMGMGRGRGMGVGRRGGQCPWQQAPAPKANQ